MQLTYSLANDAIRVARLLFLHEEGIAFNASYVAPSSQFEALEPAIAYSFYTLMKSSDDCQLTHGELLEVNSPWLTRQVQLDGRPTDDSEWADAACIYAFLEGPTVLPTRWWLKNDGDWLYLLATVWVEQVVEPGAEVLYFWPYPFQDRWQNSDLGYVGLGENPVWDAYGWDEENFYDDTEASPPGAYDVEGNTTLDGAHYWFEFRKALNSGEALDWSWTAGELVGTGETGDLMLGIFDSADLSFYGTYILLQLAEE
jgi:hypothetical protein